MPKEELKLWKGRYITDRVYFNKIRLRELVLKNKQSLQENKMIELKAQAEQTSTINKRIHEAKNVTNDNGSNANGENSEIETVYYQNENEESEEIDNVEAPKTPEIIEAEESAQETHVVEGRRIVEIAELGKKLWCGTCKEALSLSNVEKECRRGFGSLFLVRCHKCLITNEVTTGKMHALTPDSRALRFDINTDLALGILNSGIPVATFNKVLGFLKIPTITYRTLKKYEEEIGEEEIAAIKARRNCAPVLEEDS